VAALRHDAIGRSGQLEAECQFQPVTVLLVLLLRFLEEK
jgi:hypothetical protein